VKASSDERRIDALLRSAASDAARPGAKARAVARLYEQAGSQWLTSRGLTGALAIVLVATTLGAASRGAPSRSAGPEAHESRFAPPEPCGVSIEAPAASCADVFAGTSAAIAGGSSGGGGEGVFGPRSSG
jgi:hypothetical protein